MAVRTAALGLSVLAALALAVALLFGYPHSMDVWQTRAPRTTVPLSSAEFIQRMTNRFFPSCVCQNGTAAEGCGFLDSIGNLVNKPGLVPKLQTAPCVLRDLWLPVAVPSPVAGDSLPVRVDDMPRPVHSVILTVHNQERVIGLHVTRLLKLTTESWELVVVFDDCRDRSVAIVEHLLQELVVEPYLGHDPARCLKLVSRASRSHARAVCDARAKPPPGLVRVLLIQQRTSVFETTANNIGMRAARGRYWTLVQDDMELRERGWNSVLVAPLRLFADAFASSARCAEVRYSRITPHHDALGHYVGKCTMDFEQLLSLSERARCAFYIRDSVCRGPLAMRASMVKQLGYMDEWNFYLGNDDHDLNARAWVQHGWVAGYTPVEVIAPMYLGTSRLHPNRSAEERAFLEIRKKRGGTSGFDVGTLRLPSHSENRMLPTDCAFRGDWFLADELVSLDTDAPPTSNPPTSPAYSSRRRPYERTNYTIRHLDDRRHCCVEKLV